MTTTSSHPHRRAEHALAVAALLLLAVTVRGADDGWTVTLSPQNSFGFWFLLGDQPVMSTGEYGWGPNWGGLPHGAPPSATRRGIDGKLELTGKWCDGVTTSLSAAGSGDRDFVCHWSLDSAQELPVLMLMSGMTLHGPFQKGELTLTREDGTESRQAIPWQRTELPGPERYKRVAFAIAEAGEIAVDIDPPCRIHPERNNLRIALAADTTKAGVSEITLTWHFPGPLAVRIDDDGVKSFIKPLAGPDWFPLTHVADPAKAGAPSAIDMGGWLDKPAGKHGGVRMRDDRFVLEDGTPIKFWGTNFSYADVCAPEKKFAEATAKRLAKYGINGVRLHKFTTPAGKNGVIDPDDATKYLAPGLDRLDYMCAKLAESGVYFGFSHTYVFQIPEGNKDRLLAYDEIKAHKGNTYGMINYAEDVQDLLIERVVNLLKHPNPYTGKTYAEDPALAYVELQNEDDIFFYTSAGAMDEKTWPKYMANLKGRYADWLTQKYGTQDALAKAWADSLKAGETLESRDIHLQGNPWFFTNVNLKRISPGERLRMLDNAAFFHEVQNRFYGRMKKAIRDAGYQGPICGSPWQAPGMVPLYYNLLSDRRVGWIDRHNYFGGGLEGTMLHAAGSGILSAGLQQVSDRPFGISEWIDVYPTMASAEGPVLMAAYGMGLQGWDASYEFQSWSHAVEFSTIVGEFPWGVWNADTPLQLGQSPTLSRMILRGDVAEGPVISTRRVSARNLAEGAFDFDDDVQQQGDIKQFAGSCPPAALAAGRCVVEFSAQDKPSEFPDLTRYRQGSAIVSATRQLSWDEAAGIVTIDTPGTKGVLGFAKDKPQTLGDATITPATPFVSILLTAAGRGETLADATSAILSAVARASNTGCTYFALDHHILDNGKAPALMEPVVATIALKRTIAAVNVLDHTGARTGRTVPVSDGSFTIDGARDQAFYYEVVFAETPAASAPGAPR
jgi:hypothetical protein